MWISKECSAGHWTWSPPPALLPGFAYIFLLPWEPVLVPLACWWYPREPVQGEPKLLLDYLSRCRENLRTYLTCFICELQMWTSSVNFKCELQRFSYLHPKTDSAFKPMACRTCGWPFWRGSCRATSPSSAPRWRRRPRGCASSGFPGRALYRIQCTS